MPASGRRQKWIPSCWYSLLPRGHFSKSAVFSLKGFRSPPLLNKTAAPDWNGRFVNFLIVFIITGRIFRWKGNFVPILWRKYFIYPNISTVFSIVWYSFSFNTLSSLTIFLMFLFFPVILSFRTRFRKTNALCSIS